MPVPAGPLPPWYVDLDTLKLNLKISDSDRDALLVDAIAAASRSIDDHTGRRFYRDDTASSWVYRPVRRVRPDPDGDLLLVDDIATTDGLVVEVGTLGGSAWSAVAGYETSPDNALAMGVAITGLRRALASWAYAATDRVRVTACWGWPAVPDVVRQACLIQAGRLFRRKDSPEGIAGSSEWGAIRVGRIDPDVQTLLAPYVIPGFGG